MTEQLSSVVRCHLLLPMGLLLDRQSSTQPRSECPPRLGGTNEERNKTRCEDSPLQGRTKVAPQRNARSGVAIGRPEKRHQKDPETARSPRQHPQHQRDSNHEFSVCSHEGADAGVRQDHLLEHRLHPGIGADGLRYF